MKIDVLLGLQWGDEGKGKVVDVLATDYEVIARFQGGPNAGHSLEFNGIKHVLHIIPSGIFHREKMNIIGNGVVIDPVIFQDEIKALQKMGLNPVENLHISKKAHLVLPTHRLMDAALEIQKGNKKIGSTLKGIGPVYTDKTARNGLRICDLQLPDLRERYQELTSRHIAVFKQCGLDYQAQLSSLETTWFKSLDCIRQFSFIDSEYELHDYLLAGKKVLAEGAQGTLLDVDFGAYPFVTSSNTIAAGAFTGLGLAPHHAGRIIGIVKAYCTRVGNGPFPTELFDETGEQLRRQGKEFGATTGRPRRCGWLDLVALKYAVMINGITEIVLTKADVMSDFDTINICTAYKIKGKIVKRMPTETNLPIKPILTPFKGWKEDIGNIRQYDRLPDALKKYIQFIEKEVNIKISMVSVGPDRDATIIR